jgi:large subunit ribosomal protein L27
MAHKKAGSSSKNGRDSVGQRLGVKRGDGQLVRSGSIIVRQRGMTFLAGTGTGLGHDYTVFATVDGHVRFEHATRHKKRIRVLPVVEAAVAAPKTKATAKPKATADKKALPAKVAKPRASAKTAEAAPNATA